MFSSGFRSESQHFVIFLKKSELTVKVLGKHVDFIEEFIGEIEGGFAI